MQLLRNNANKKLAIYSRWGRIGNPGRHKLEPIDAASAVKTFLRKYEEKINKHGYHEKIVDEDSD